MTYLNDFKKFISRGNAVDMGVGIIIGASFTQIVDVLVNHILMPPIGFVLRGVDFSSFRLILRNGAEGVPEVSIDYGLFINTIINFFIVAVSVFLLISLVGAIYKKAPNTQTCPECLMDIPLKAKRCGRCTSVLYK